MKKALATISTDIGRMVIYYNGAGNEITGENGTVVESAGYSPESEQDAIDAIASLWGGSVWDLEWIDEDLE